MTNPVYTSPSAPKASEELLDQKMAEITAARQTKMAALDSVYQTSLKERMLRNANPEVRQTDLVGTVGDVGIKLGQGVVNLGASVVGLGSLATGGAVGEGMRAIGYDPAATNEALGEHLSAAQKASDQKVAEAEGFSDTVLTSLANPRSILGTVTESLPAMLAGMGVAGAAARGIAAKAAMATVEGRLASEAAIAAGRVGMAETAALSTEAGGAAAKAAIEAAGFRLSAIGAGVEGAQAAGTVADKAQAAGREYEDYALPALAAGATTAAIGAVSNKVFGDAATDIATGARTLKGSKLAKIGKEGFSEGVTEELPQSAQEQFFTNIAMGEEDYMKGVGNAAGAGLVAGTAMGVGMGSLHKSANTVAKETQERVTTAETRQRVAAAVASNDITSFVDPKSRDYDLSRGMGVLVAHAMRPETTPEIKAENLKRAGELLSQIEEQHAKAQNDADTFSPASVAEAKAKVSFYETEIAKTTDAVKIAELQDFRDGWKDVLADATDTQAASKSRAVLSALDRQLSAGRNFMGGLVNANEAVATPEEVGTLVTAAAADNTAATRLVNLSMSQPDALSHTAALQLADDTTNSLTDSQRAHLRVFSDARQAENALSTQSKVSQEVLFGSAKNVGISQYRSRIAAAIASNSQVSADRAMTGLETFAINHEDKAATAREAMADYGMGAQIVYNKTDKKWESHPPGTFKEKDLRANGGLALNSGRLVNEIANEAKALRATHTEMNSATSLKFGVQSESSKQDNVPSGNISTPEIEEDTARPAVPAELPTAEAPPKSEKKEKVVHVGKEFATSLEAEKYLYDNFLGESLKATRKADKSGYVIESRKKSAPDANNEASAEPKKNVLAGNDKDQRVADNLAKSKAQREAREAAAKAAAVEQPAVSEANPAPAAETATPEAAATQEVKEKTTTLTVFDVAHDTSLPYQEQNLVGAHFVQSAGNEDTGTQRPLAKLVDFLSAWKNKAEGFKLSEFLSSKEAPSDEQKLVLKTFLATATAWAGNITANLRKGNPGYGFEDPIQFLMNADGKLDENTMTAIAYGAFSWVAEAATRPELNTKEDINAILGRDESAPVSTLEYNALEHIGVRQNIVANALGQRIVAALGLKSLASAPRNLQADLEASIGAHAMKLLLDQGILTRNTITGQEMAELTKSDKTQTNAKFYFLKLARADGKLGEQAEAIFQANKGTNGILDKLFGVEPALKAPSSSPVESKQKTTRNTSMAIPSELAEQVRRDDAEASYVRADMFNLAGQVSPDTMLQIAGQEDPNKVVHKSRRKSLQAKNDGLARELERFMNYVGEVGSDAAMYFEHSVWMQQRVGIATNMINPQTSKIHRHMLYRSAWETKIAFGDTAAMTNFKLRVAEGLGVKTDKKSKEKALADFNKLVAKPEIKAAVAVLVKSLTGTESGVLSENDQAVLVAGVKAGGEDMHSLDALMAMAQMTVAKKAGATEFTTQMMAEVDGVTNGPMLSHLLLGAANTVKEMYALLNRGGFFEQGNDHIEYNTWRDAPENFDLYENTALHMTQAINAANLDPELMASIYAFTGELADSKGVVQKAGRNIIKTPLTAMVFGSSVNNAVDSMADNFVDSIYTAIEEGEMTPGEILLHLEVMGVRLPTNIDLMEHEFTSQQIKTLKGAFKDSLGVAVEETMKQDFEVFIAQRTEFNKTAQLTFEVYNAVYQGMREEMITQLVADGKMAVNPKTGVPIHDLTNAQEVELRKQTAALLPVMNTPMSQESKDLEAGIMVAKAERKLSDKDTYQNVVKFGQPFEDGSKSTQVHGYETTPAGPGVAMVPVSMHSADSAISVRANVDGQALNIHDAQGHGVGGIVETARRMNEATWDTMLNYSPANEVKNALLRTVRGLNAMLAAGKVSDATMAKLAKSLVTFAEKHDVPPEGVLYLQAELAQSMAYRADSMKLDTMSTMTAVNQYAMEGGAFAVESSHRSSAASLRSALEVGVSDVDRSALTSVSDKLEAAIKAEMASRPAKEKKGAAKADPEMETKPVNANPVAQLGKPLGRYDPKLTAAFKAKPNQTVKEVVALLRKTMKDDFSMKLLSQLERTVAGNMVVKYITKDTVPADLIHHEISQNARGMYINVADGIENQAIYVMSDDFVYSGLDNEVLLHEMVHAALVQTTRAEQAIRDGEIINNEGEKPAKPYTSDALKLVEELEALMEMAKQYVASSESPDRIAYYSRVFENLDEFIAYGMTNAEFQNDVMAAISYTSKTGGNRLITAMAAFIDKITALFFGRPNAAMSSGMTTFLSNVSGLFEQAAQQNKPAAAGPVTLAISTPGAANVRDLSTLDIYAALAQSNNGAQISAEHSTHLQGLLSTLVKSVYGPFGSFKAALMEQTAQDPLDVYADALSTGVAPFASESLAAGFGFTDQEAFVLEQVEATMRTALSHNDGVMTVAYKEMTRLYNEVRAKLTVESFHKGDWTTATQIEKDQAKALYDFVFAIKQDATGKSDYMSRFAALGLVHSGFREQLQFHTATGATNNPSMGFNERLNKIFNTIMSWVAGRLTKTFRGQMADKKLNALVKQMVEIEAKRHNRITSGASQTLNRIADTAEDMSDSVRAAVEAFGKKPFFQNSGNAFVKLGGNVMSAVAGDRVDAIMDAYLRLRDKTMTGQLGVAASLMNEVRGATDMNKVYHFLLRGTKHLEGIRKDTISNISKAVSGSFVNAGEDLTDDQKKALTAVVLRGDMQSLLGTYTVAQLQNLVNSTSDLQTEIDSHEAQLVAGGKMNRFYINSAKGLGYFMATSRVATAHQLMNAGNIARLYGTGMSVTPAQALAAAPIIDRLASLYALKYASRVDMKMLSEVFAAEAARTDGGHGIEMIMKTHTALQAESKDKLFSDSEALQMKGYVPEIYDPYMTVVMATDDEGIELVKKGYTAMPGYLPRDAADPVSDQKRIYSLRDGGLKQWNSGIISTTDSKAKGSQVITGAHPVSVAGQQNAMNMAAIRIGKRPAIQSMFTGTGFDPTAVKEAHMAPVLNPNGDVTNYRYMMSNVVKDKLLNRDNRTDHLLGSMAGNTFDKVASKVQNANAIKALHEQYKLDFADHPEAYLQVGPTSADPQLREIWDMLPRDTQQLAKSLFGKDGMLVRNDILDMNFGYRKLSIGTVFEKEKAQRSFVENMFVEIMSYAFKDKAQLRARQSEDIWQAIVKETKANLVVKSWSTMTGNLRSNWSQLFLMGVSPKQIFDSHRVAFKSAWEYKQDNAKLFALKHQQTIGHFEPGMNASKAAYLIQRLEDSLARNPIRPLIDAGLMPTIVEDVGVDEDIYSYKSRFDEKVDGFIEGVNPHILKGVQLLTMHHSTAPYKMMSYATQISDFLARYTLYQHDVKSMTHEQAVQRASEAFINYDVPTHRKIQYANDTGLIMFSKYYVRIQKVLARIYKDSPGRVLALMAAEHMLGDQPTVMDSSFIHHFGNPFNAGALSYFGSLDSVTTVGLLTGPFTTAVYNGQ
jgi:hypothetical protein